MSPLNEYKSWQDHYLSMVNGQIPPNQKVYVVDTRQSGSGKLQIVSPAAQKVERARATLKAIKSKLESKTNQKRLKRRRVQRKAPTKPKPKSKSKSKRRR